MAMGPEVTYEVWIRAERAGCLFAVEEGAGTGRRERVRVQVGDDKVVANYSGGRRIQVDVSLGEI
jgi:hypothetical protein